MPNETAISERIALALLRLVGDRPGEMGRLRASRIVGGYPVQWTDTAPDLKPYTVDCDWPISQTLAMLDALIAGGLVTQTTGMRPTIVLTRTGHRALDALEVAA